MAKDINKIGWGTKFACFLVGWNADILKECGEASRRTLRKYVSALIILSIIWGVIGYCFASNYIRLENLFAKIAVSLTFITIILCVERYIILTGKLNWKMGTARVILAMLMAILGSTIFDQIMFKDDVEFMMKEQRTELVLKETAKRNQIIDAELNKLKVDIDSLNRENTFLNEQIVKKPSITTVAVSTKNKVVGTDEQGNPIYAEERSVDRNVIENPLINQFKSNETVRDKYIERQNELQSQKLNTQENVRIEYEETHKGFLIELNALISLLSKDIVALVFYIILFLFLMMLELLVIMSKGGDGDSDYDLVVHHQQRIKAATLKRMEEGLLSK